MLTGSTSAQGVTREQQKLRNLSASSQNLVEGSSLPRTKFILKNGVFFFYSKSDISHDKVLFQLETTPTSNDKINEKPYSWFNLHSVRSVEVSSNCWFNLVFCVDMKILSYFKFIVPSICARDWSYQTKLF